MNEKGNRKRNRGERTPDRRQRSRPTDERPIKISDYVKNRKVDKMYLYILINILKLILRTFSIISYFSVGHLFKIRGAERQTERDRDILVARVRVMKLTGTSGWQSTARMGQVQVPAPEYGGFATGMASRRRS